MAQAAPGGGARVLVAIADVDMVLADDGSLQGSDIYAATVRSRAKLANNGVAAWLEGHGPVPQGILTFPPTPIS